MKKQEEFDSKQTAINDQVSPSFIIIFFIVIIMIMIIIIIIIITNCAVWPREVFQPQESSPRPDFLKTYTETILRGLYHKTYYGRNLQFP
jgi:hypothetical protein